MFTRRVILSVAAATMVAACSNITSIDRADKEVGPLKLNAVSVDVSQMKLVSEGRTINKSTAQFAEDLEAALVRELSAVSVPDGVPADFNVTVQRMYLAPIVNRLVAGTSSIESSVSVINASDGSTIVEPVKVVGNSDQLRGPGPVGAVTTKTVEADYQGAVNGYAKALLASLQASK